MKQEGWKPIVDEAGNRPRYGGIERRRATAIEPPLPDQPLDPGRRRALRALLGGMGVSLAVAYGIDRFGDGEPAPESTTEDAPPEPAEETEEEVETVEIIERSEQFEAIEARWKAWWSLPLDQVQFCDESGALVGAPIKLVDVVLGDPAKPSEQTRIDTGGTDLEDTIRRGIRPAWTAYQKEQVPGATDLIHTTAEMKAALTNEAEPALATGVAAAIAGKEGIRTNMDIVSYFAWNTEKSVPGDAQARTYGEYLQEELVLSTVSETVEEELRRLCVGLAAKESRFNTKLKKNSKTAQQALQLTDGVRVEFLYSKDSAASQAEIKAKKDAIADRELSFPEEVLVAGKELSRLPSQVAYWVNHDYVKQDGGWKTVEREDLLPLIRACFTCEEDFERYFLVPASITAYNAGGRRVGEAIYQFVKAKQHDLPHDWGNTVGYDLFLAVSQFAKRSTDGLLEDWGDDVYNYFPAVAAYVAVREQQLTTDNVQFASAG